MLWSDLHQPPGGGDREFAAARAMLRRAGWLIALAAPLALLLISR
ncbi:morphogenic membrane protein MmpB [Streptomyces millisiae]|uniref:Uncharacterized protein n=1 Tax=Streptomyces millisiae TaxID=3075542 RepID=A0ABU2LVE8_9ACTN|nr:hypothetical protein [Streptomyces sp. DSM 44918]MDT0321581.1 hypothetical protein [Streptomyces sp. DSM 44918]